MKKSICFFLALSMVLGIVVPVQATEVTNSVGSVQEDITNETKTGQDTAQGKQSEYQQATKETESTKVYLTKVSTFTVTIPKTVILDGETDSGNYAVKVEGNLSGTETVKVVPDESFTMSQEGKEDISATVEQDKTEWGYDEVETTATGTVQAIDATAGSWNGSFNFNISKVTASVEQEPEEHTHNFVNNICTECNAQEAGLYDADGVMLASWDEAGIDVEKDYNVFLDTADYYKTNIASGYYVLTNTYPTARKVVLPENITKIGTNVFTNSTNVTSIEIPNNVTSVGRYAFDTDSLTSVTWNGMTYTDKAIFNQALKDAGIATEDVWS